MTLGKVASICGEVVRYFYFLLVQIIFGSDYSRFVKKTMVITFVSFERRLKEIS